MTLSRAALAPHTRVGGDLCTSTSRPRPRSRVRLKEGLTALALASMIALASPTGAAGQATADVRGRVVALNGSPATDAVVRLLGTSRSLAVDSTGAFAFQEVPSGEYIIEALSPSAGRAAERLIVSDATIELELELSLVYRGEQIVVTAGREALLSEVVQPATVVKGDELLRLVEPSLGETVGGEPGINSTYFAPGASRPVIRGFQRDRIRVLGGGIGTADASESSPDHAVTLEPLAAQRIEILRGPATLLYGGSAVGGVVNVLDGRIPSELPTRSVTGLATVRGASVSDEVAGVLALDGRIGRFAWHASGLLRETSDYRIPGPAEAPHDEQEPGHEEPVDGSGENSGILENSSIKTSRATLGLSWIGANGYIGVSGYAFDTKYGVPGHGDLEEGVEHVDEHALSAARAPLASGEGQGETVDARQRRFDFEGAWRFGSGVVRGLKARFGIADYRDLAFESSGELGTRKDNDEWETRIEAEHAPLGSVEGIFGMQIGSRRFEAAGEEAFVPVTDTDRRGVFLYERIPAGRVSVELGTRYEWQDVRDLEEGSRLDHDGVSLSAGVNWSITRVIGLAATAARTVKLPVAEELFADGPHLPTFQYEIGNPGLEDEVGLTTDASFRLLDGPVTGEITAFVTSFSDYIFLSPTGEERLGLPVYEWVQADARYTGFEIEAAVPVWRRTEHFIALDVWGDYVRAELTASDLPLPRIPPLRFGAAGRYEGERWRARVGAYRVTEQDRVAPLETVTPGYTMLDASVGYRFLTGGLVHDVSLTGRNLTDEMARNHVSFNKDNVPLPGRDVRLTYRLLF